LFFSNCPLDPSSLVFFLAFSPCVQPGVFRSVYFWCIFFPPLFYTFGGRRSTSFSRWFLRIGFPLPVFPHLFFPSSSFRRSLPPPRKLLQYNLTLRFPPSTSAQSSGFSPPPRCFSWNFRNRRPFFPPSLWAPFSSFFFGVFLAPFEVILPLLRNFALFSAMFSASLSHPVPCKGPLRPNPLSLSAGRFFTCDVPFAVRLFPDAPSLPKVPPPHFLSAGSQSPSLSRLRKDDLKAVFFGSPFAKTRLLAFGCLFFSCCPYVSVFLRSRFSSMGCVFTQRLPSLILSPFRTSSAGLPFRHSPRNSSFLR